MESTLTIATSDAVAAGMRLLDERGPADWMQRIDLDRLDITYASRCVLGQVYGTFAVGAEALDIPTTALGSYPYGFSALNVAATGEWRRQIRLRRSRAGAERKAAAEPELVGV